MTAVVQYLDLSQFGLIIPKRCGKTTFFSSGYYFAPISCIRDCIKRGTGPAHNCFRPGSRRLRNNYYTTNLISWTRD